MRSAWSLSVIVCISSLTLSTAAAEPPVGPIAGALHREASRLAATNATLDETRGEPWTTSDWQSVRGLHPGTTVVVTVDSGVRQSGQFVVADDTQLTIRNVLGRTQTTPRDRIAAVRTRTRYGSVGGAVGGAVVGAAIGLPIAANLAFGVRCQPSCGGVEAGIVLSGVGIPIAGGVLGYHGFAHTTERIIYRNP
jgi:hypothetical protein